MTPTRLVTLPINRLGLVTLPERFVGRISRATGQPSISAAAVLRECADLSPGTVRSVLAGSSRPTLQTLRALDAVGIVIHREPYSQKERTFHIQHLRCESCGRPYTRTRSTKPSHYCSRACASRAWRSDRGKGFCNYCGKPSTRYAFACDDHVAVHKANQRRQHEKKKARAREGWCIDCPTRRATVGQRCDDCRAKATEYARRRRKLRRNREQAERLRKGWITTTEARRLLRLRHVVGIHYLIRKGKIREAARTGKKPRIWVDGRDVYRLMKERGIATVAPQPREKTVAHVVCPRCRAQASKDEDGVWACWRCGWRPTRTLAEVEKSPRMPRWA